MWDSAPSWLDTQLVEHCTGITEVMVLISQLLKMWNYYINVMINRLFMSFSYSSYIWSFINSLAQFIPGLQHSLEMTVWFFWQRMVFHRILHTVTGSSTCFWWSLCLQMAWNEAYHVTQEVQKIHQKLCYRSDQRGEKYFNKMWNIIKNYIIYYVY